eukprot:1578366-Prymnesium_polylepis.1
MPYQGGTCHIRAAHAISGRHMPYQGAARACSDAPSAASSTCQIRARANGQMRVQRVLSAAGTRPRAAP